MIRVSLLAALAIVVVALFGCSGGAGVVTPPAPVDIIGVSAGAGGSVYGAPGTADPGTTARSGGTGGVSATVASDGSFTIHLAAVGTSTSIVFTRGGALRTQTVQFTPLSSRIHTPLFATGSAPNDMLYASNALYIANSLDNTVGVYSRSGTQEATHTFPQYASPSYLGLGSNVLWVVCNGSNTITGLNAVTLSALDGQEFSLADPSVAFIGPSQPAVAHNAVFVPRNQIATFAPTTYGPGLFTQLTPDDHTQADQTTSGLNAQYSAYDEQHGVLYIVCTGDIQFDSEYHPSATSDSIVEVYAPASGMQHLASINLGRVGAGRIALSPNGDIAYVGNAINGNVYKLDLFNYTVLRGEANPIVATDIYTYIADVAFTPDGAWLLAASFNTDEVYVIDPATDSVNPGPYPAPFDMALDPNLLAGVANIEVAPRQDAPEHYSAYVLYAVGNAVGRIDLF